MDTLSRGSSDFTSLSLKDLLQARDLFHYHLMNKKNVVATAVGLYRIRHDDPWPSEKKPLGDTSRKQKPRRTLFNSEVRPYSWPCIYAFVSSWEEEAKLSKTNPTDVVPKTLYLPDGRSAPVCVIEARKQAYAEDMEVEPRKLSPRNFFGPGVPILNNAAQGLKKIATGGCLVKDGDSFYVLTNKHAVGAPGTVIRAMKGYSEVEVGITARKGLTRKLFQEIYPHFESEYQYLLLDIGLVQLRNVQEWKTTIHGIDPVDRVLDLYDNAFRLRLIGMKVVGESAITGRIRGEIQGLFYRYKAQGGYEYLSDFLIGPETAKADRQRVGEEPEHKNIGLKIHHGDSGTLLFIEQPQATDANQDKAKPPIFVPFALLWGKHEFIEDNSRRVQPYALATSLSTVLEKLELDFVQDLNLDNDYVWGYVGHYAIGSLLPFTVKLLGSDKLRAFIENNYHLLTLDEGSIVGNDPKVIAKDEDGNYLVDSPNFVPLADVPDNVWKNNVNIYMVDGDDGKKHRKTGPGARGDFDNANHFADVDLPYGGFKTFLDFNLSDLDKNLRPSVWLDFYKEMKPRYDEWAAALGQGKTPPAYKHWGALPFRVWQLFDLMKTFAESGKQDEFLCAGGVLIHYVGDACQPLHSSYLSQGDPEDLVDRPQAEGKKMRADGVHSGYEDDMVEYGYSNASLMDKLRVEIERQEHDAAETIIEVNKGFDAAKSIIYLVQKTQGTLPPREIVDKWVELKAGGASKKERDKKMWDAFGTETVTCIARGCRYLAAIWQAAWGEKGDTEIGKGTTRNEQDIMDLYNDPNFLPSWRLDNYTLDGV
jgi:hypothetical protein